MTDRHGAPHGEPGSNVPVDHPRSRSSAARSNASARWHDDPGVSRRSARIPPGRAGADPGEPDEGPGEPGEDAPAPRGNPATMGVQDGRKGDAYPGIRPDPDRSCRPRPGRARTVVERAAPGWPGRRARVRPTARRGVDVDCRARSARLDRDAQPRRCGAAATVPAHAPCHVLSTDRADRRRQRVDRRLGRLHRGVDRAVSHPGHPERIQPLVFRWQ